MPYIDLARKQEPCCGETAKMPESPRVSYPSMYLDVPDVPDIKINTTIEAKVKLKLTGMSTNKYGSEKSKTSLNFDVVAIDLGDTKKESAESDLSEAISGQQAELDKD